MNHDDMNFQGFIAERLTGFLSNLPVPIHPDAELLSVGKNIPVDPRLGKKHLLTYYIAPMIEDLVAPIREKNVPVKFVDLPPLEDGRTEVPLDTSLPIRYCVKYVPGEPFDTVIHVLELNVVYLYARCGR